MVGSSISRKLEEEGFTNIVVRTSSELELRNQQLVNDFFAHENLITFSWRQQKWVAFIRTINTVLNLFMKT